MLDLLSNIEAFHLNPSNMQDLIISLKKQLEKASEIDKF